MTEKYSTALRESPPLLPLPPWRWPLLLKGAKAKTPRKETKAKMVPTMYQSIRPPSPLSGQPCGLWIGVCVYMFGRLGIDLVVQEWIHM